MELKEATKRIVEIYFDVVEPVFPIETMGERGLIVQTMSSEGYVRAEVEESGTYGNMNIEYREGKFYLVFWTEYQHIVKVRFFNILQEYKKIIRACQTQNIDVLVSFDDDPHGFTLRQAMEQLEKYEKEI